jgi:hypothetical protein
MATPPRRPPIAQREQQPPQAAADPIAEQLARDRADREQAIKAAATPSTPTPTQHENDAYRQALDAGTLHVPWAHAQDGSTVDPASPNPTPPPPTWP